MQSDKLRPNFAVLLALAFAVVAAWLLTQFWSSAAAGFSDPDDAMRLVQVREFIAGKGWFDLYEPRVNPPYGYLTHWSRLIDAGLAGLFMLARVFTGPAMAERVMIAVWPVLWLIPVMGGVCALAWRCGGRAAALAALVLAVFGLPAFQHFQPGRIDHHNVQIALAVLAVAAAAWSDRVHWASVATGLLSALALAVGLESLPWIVLAGVAMALRFIFEREGARSLCAYGMSLAVGTLAAFFIDVNPANWFVSVCDALAVNLALPVVVAGALLALVSVLFARASRNMRAAGILFCAAVALGIFIAIEPRCLGGPFAMMDPAVRPIWLAQVREMTPLFALWRQAPTLAAWTAAFPMVSIVAALLLLNGERRRDFGFLVAISALAFAAVLTVAMVKAYSYAMWFGMPVAALAATALAARFAFGAPVRWLIVLALTPVAVSAGALMLTPSDGREHPLNDARSACYKTGNYAGLAGIAPGLVVSDADLGPMLLAFTPHTVLAAPYHRLSSSIIMNHRALSAPPDEARQVLAAVHATYVVLCGKVKPSGLSGAALTEGLWARLVAGEVPKWLARVPIGTGSATDGVFVVYRVIA